MTKTNMKRVLTLYSCGVPKHTCILVILQMNYMLNSKSITHQRDTANDICTFFNLITNFPDTYLEEL